MRHHLERKRKEKERGAPRLLRWHQIWSRLAQKLQTEHVPIPCESITTCSWVYLVRLLVHSAGVNVFALCGLAELIFVCIISVRLTPCCQCPAWFGFNPPRCPRIPCLTHGSRSVLNENNPAAGRFVCCHSKKKKFKKKCMFICTVSHHSSIQLFIHLIALTDVLIVELIT